MKVKERNYSRMAKVMAEDFSNIEDNNHDIAQYVLGETIADIKAATFASIKLLNKAEAKSEFMVGELQATLVKYNESIAELLKRIEGLDRKISHIENIERTVSKKISDACSAFEDNIEVIATEKIEVLTKDKTRKINDAEKSAIKYIYIIAAICIVPMLIILLSLKGWILR